METILNLLGASSIAGGIIVVAGILAALTAIWLFIQKVRKRYKGVKNKWNNVYDSIVGSEAIVDPETGVTLRVERKAIGTRVAIIEEWQAEVAKALNLLADNQARMIKVEEHMQKMQEQWQEREQAGMQIVKEWQEWRDSFTESKQTEHEKMWEAIRDLSNKP